MKTIIWPVYIDVEKSKKQGRKIAKKYAVPSPKLNEISNAAKKLKLNPEVEQSKSYPTFWWESSGRVLVDKELPKREILEKISNIIKTSRSKK
ncbi:MAG: signal recognition particle protein Srp19 [Methanobacteriaceae archaeon]|nr:MAG: signal recognition particle protein Srp19 [Methanobacterium sp. BRmetb2]MCC7558278.1 signal recognition particle protein Srp19 [Methanobacteriaceae archaeon]